MLAVPAGRYVVLALGQACWLSDEHLEHIPEEWLLLSLLKKYYQYPGIS